MKRLVIYHANCADGFAAAWAAWRTYGAADTEYIAAVYDQPPPDVAGREVLIVDFSYPRRTLIDMAERAASLQVFDHHRTAQADLEGLPFAEFDLNRSGAGITWDMLRLVARPWLIDYVEDRDLWRFKLPRSKQINAWISTVPRTFKDWSELEAIGEGVAATKGETVLCVLDRYVRETAVEARRVHFETGPRGVGVYNVPFINASYFGTSELLHHLAEGEPFAVSWRQRADGRFEYSLRSKEGGVDVSEIARRYGGGGHKHAAGFSLDELLWFQPAPAT